MKSYCRGWLLSVRPQTETYEHLASDAQAGWRVLIVLSAGSNCRLSFLQWEMGAEVAELVCQRHLPARPPRSIRIDLCVRWRRLLLPVWVLLNSSAHCRLRCFQSLVKGWVPDGSAHREQCSNCMWLTLWSLSQNCIYWFIFTWPLGWPFFKGSFELLWPLVTCCWCHLARLLQLLPAASIQISFGWKKQHRLHCPKFQESDSSLVHRGGASHLSTTNPEPYKFWLCVQTYQKKAASRVMYCILARCLVASLVDFGG